MSLQGESVATQLERLASLKERQILTDAEFEAQKMRLLAGSSAIEITSTITRPIDNRRIQPVAQQRTEVVFQIRFPSEREFESVVTDVSTALQVSPGKWVRKKPRGSIIESIGLAQPTERLWSAHFPVPIRRRDPTRYAMENARLTQIAPTLFQIRFDVCPNLSLLATALTCIGALFVLAAFVVALRGAFATGVVLFLFGVPFAMLGNKQATDSQTAASVAQAMTDERLRKLWA
jgi:hypothetical protein